MHERFIWLLITLFSTSLWFTSCTGNDELDDPESNAIAEVIAGNTGLSTLADALARAELTEMLTDDGPFTFFAPSNAAFDNFLSGAGFSSPDEIPTDVLKRVLLNHVISGRVSASEFSTGYISTMAHYGSNGQQLSMFVNTAEGVELNGTARVSQADVEADNGVIHIVDALIGLPVVAALVTADPALETLLAALTDSRLPNNYAEVLSESGPFTLFAPDNDAFAALFAELGVNGPEEVHPVLLEQVLLYHVAGGANIRSEDLVGGMTIQTLQGTDFAVNSGTEITLTDGEGNIVTVLFTDVQAANGVVHLIDRVLMPLTE